MKKTLLSVFGALAVGSVMAQTPSPSWQTLQNTSYTVTSASSKFLDVVSSSVVWAAGYDGTSVSANYNWYTRTTNGGATFTGGNVFADTNTYQISNMEGVDANTAWVAAFNKSAQAQGAIFKTTNGGTTWNNMSAAGMYTNSASFCNIVSFLTPAVGITMGDPNGPANEFEIWKTTDGGTTWAQISGANIPNPTSGEFGTVNVYEKNGTTNFWFGTIKGRIFRSTDAGSTWNVSVLPGTPTASLIVTDIAFSTALKGIVTVANGTVFEEYVTSDGGVTWTQVTTVDPNMGKNDVCGIPGTGVFASVANNATGTSISYSKDGGITWIDWGAVGIPYLAIDFADATSGWAATFQSAPSTGGIYKFNGPTSIFNLPSTYLCLSGPSATIAPTNMSLGNATVTYSWSSGTGVSFSSATAASPVITFTAAGTYTINLLATNSTTTSTSSQTIQVLTCAVPTASFSTPTGTLCNKVAFTFTNTSTGSPTPTYTWSVLPLTATISPSSNATSPTITFGAAGVYSVSLLASNGGGTATATQTVQITDCSPVASFTIPASATTCTGTPFTPIVNVTGNAPISYAWSISPLGGVSFSPNAFTVTPSIQGLAAGLYTITLKATNTSGSVTATQTINITSCTTGIHENSGALASISVFPNPNNGVFNVANTLNDNINYSVTNILGSVVLTGKFNTAKNIDLSGQSKGIYFIIFESNGSKMSKKIIIE